MWQGGGDRCVPGVMVRGCIDGSRHRLLGVRGGDIDTTGESGVLDMGEICSRVIML